MEEVIQKDLAERAGKELNRILDDQLYVQQMKEGYRELKNSLGEKGVSQRIGRRMVELLKVEFE